MDPFKEEKLSSALKDIASSFFEAKMSHEGMVTVTGVVLSKNFSEATILFSVYPEEKEKETIKEAERSMSTFRKYVRSRIKTRVVPFFSAKIDKGEKERQKIEKLLEKSRK